MVRCYVTAAPAGVMAGKLDETIRSALDRFLPNGWTMDDLKRRCTRDRIPGSEVETLCCDGVPLLEIHPIELEQVQTETGWSYRLTQRYRDLRASENRGGSL